MFITNGKKEVDFQGQKVAKQIKIWGDKLYLGEGEIQIFSQVIENDNGNVVIHKDAEPIALKTFAEIPMDTLLKTNPEATEFITFGQMFQAVCHMCDRIWGNDFSNDSILYYEEYEEYEEL